jgi:hypothetical protein
LETTPACSADAVSVALPLGTVLPVKPGCHQAAAEPSGGVTDKVKAWFKNIVH